MVCAAAIWLSAGCYGERGDVFFCFFFFVFAAPAERQAAVLSVLIVTDTVVGHESAE